MTIQDITILSEEIHETNITVEGSNSPLMQQISKEVKFRYPDEVQGENEITFKFPIGSSQFRFNSEQMKAFIVDYLNNPDKFK